jgi:membrane fusion protein (multidrug efflux system)
MKRALTIILIIVVVAGLALIKIFFLSENNTQQPMKQGKDQPVNVTTFIVQPEKLENKLFATGTVLANEEVELRPEASGKIVQLLFKEGSRVNKGELLLKINDEDLQAQLKKLQIELKLAEEKESRQAKLLKAGGTSQEEYDAAQNNLNTLKADADLLRAQIRKTEIYAPFNGIIGLKNVSEGSYVSPTIKIASIQQTDPLKIDFSVPEKYALLLKKGDSIRFTVTGSDKTFSGQIYAIEPRIDPGTRTLQLRAICQNKNGEIFPGSFAKVEIVISGSSNSILIPTESVIPELKGQKVFLVKNGRAVSQKVETGLRTDTRIEITQGLQQGDSIVVTGILQLKPGSKVKVVK